MHALPTSPDSRAWRRAAAATLAVTSLLAASGPARARAGEDGAPPADLAARTEKPYALLLDGAFGVATRDSFAADAVLRLHTPGLTFGAVVGGGGRVLGERHDEYYGLVAGIRHPVSEALRLEVLGEAGLNAAQLCSGLFAPGGCASTTLPYLGVRAGADLRFGRRLALVVGAWTVLRADLGRERLTSEGVDLGQAGGTTLAFQGRLGVELGFGD